MKHTTSRKKMLLSSVAMLLVAMLALGSATFAWFTTNPTVTASGIKMTANTSTGLAILSDSAQKAGGTFGSSTILNAKQNGSVVEKNTASFTVNPVSGIVSSGTAKYFKTTAASNDSSAALNTAIVYAAAPFTFNNDGTGINSGKDFYIEDVKVKTTGAATTKNVTLTKIKATFGADTLAQALRIAIVDFSGDVAAVYRLQDEAATGTDKYLTGTAGTAYSTFTKTAFDSGINDTLVSDTATDASVSLGTLSGGSESTYKVVVYLDGEDAACKTDNAISISDLLTNLELTLTASDPTT